MADEQVQADQIEGKQGDGGGRLLFRIIGFIFLAAALLLSIYGVVAFSAWRQGQDLRQEKERSALEQDLAEQVDLAMEDSSSGNYLLAMRRLEWVLERDPEFPGARSLFDEVQRQLGLLLTPSPTSTPTATPEIIEVEIGPDPSESYEELEKLYEDKEWESLASAVPPFQASFPNYRRQDTDRMAYESYIEVGKELLNSEQVELGLFYFTQAERLGDLPTEVEDQRSWAQLYLTGIGYFGVDWGLTVINFRDLCAAAPFFHGACEKFHQALTAYGDQYAHALDWCPAEDLYREAVGVESNSELREALQQAAEGCAEATPTPTPTKEGTELPEGTPTPVSD